MSEIRIVENGVIEFEYVRVAQLLPRLAPSLVARLAEAFNAVDEDRIEELEERIEELEERIEELAAAIKRQEDVIERLKAQLKGTAT